ncbi:hypothetical protein [Litchfieldella qijiaojingensis]|nr:hypothetical protein [Halomonas qijiaojingensis]
MMSNELLKRIGILCVSFGLLASPMAFSMEEPEYDPQASGQSDPEWQEAPDPSGASDSRTGSEPDPTMPETEPAPGAGPDTSGTESGLPPQGDEAGFGSGGEALPQEETSEPWEEAN